MFLNLTFLFVEEFLSNELFNIPSNSLTKTNEKVISVGVYQQVKYDNSLFESEVWAYLLRK